MCFSRVLNNVVIAYVGSYGKFVFEQPWYLKVVKSGVVEVDVVVVRMMITVKRRKKLFFCNAILVCVVSV